MNVVTTLKLAMRALWRSKVRTLLTMLGIVFGIGAVIAMVAFGQGAQASVKEVFANLGTNTLVLSNAQTRSTQGPSAGASGGASITWDDVNAVATEVRDVFRSPKFGNIAGCLVIDGFVRRNSPIRVLRNNTVIYQGELESLRRFKDDATEVRAGTECGIGVRNYDDVKPGDQIECYERVTIERTA